MRENRLCSSYGEGLESDRDKTQIPRQSLTRQLFHRDTKRQLGMTDAGVQNFDSLTSHVHWVYCAYLLLKQQKSETDDNPSSILHRQKILTKKWEEQRYRKIIQLSTRFNGANAVKAHCNEVIADLKLA